MFEERICYQTKGVRLPAPDVVVTYKISLRGSTTGKQGTSISGALSSAIQLTSKRLSQLRRVGRRTGFDSPRRSDEIRDVFVAETGASSTYLGRSTRSLEIGPLLLIVTGYLPIALRDYQHHTGSFIRAWLPSYGVRFGVHRQLRALNYLTAENNVPTPEFERRAPIKLRKFWPSNLLSREDGTEIKIEDPSRSVPLVFQFEGGTEAHEKERRDGS
ncbi:hypothetical protein C8R43DRAFT_962230 [Mycena crocata]|nr:hypothetical protein C8R43DRAFT_962230 [Mycena crocata]